MRIPATRPKERDIRRKEKALAGPQVKDWKKYEALRLEGYSKESAAKKKESAAKIANARRPQEEEQAITENQQPEPEQLPTVRL